MLMIPSPRLTGTSGSNPTPRSTLTRMLAYASAPHETFFTVVPTEPFV
jgi:hypothetical protein